MNRTLCTLLCFVAFALAAAAQAQTSPEGGVTMTMSHSVVASGGGYSQWTQPDLQPVPAGLVPNFEVTGTIGQGIAGTTSTSGQLSLHGGFWFADPLQPTAATASISGHINDLGALNRRVRVVVTKVSTGERRIAAVNGLGYYEISDLEVTELYLVRAVGKGILFAPETRMVNLLDAVTGVDFTAIPIE